LDGKNVTRKVKTGKTYGHIVRTTQYFQLREIDIRIDSRLLDTKQLKFGQLGQSWYWQLHLGPFDAAQQQTEVLVCRFPKARVQDTINVDVTGDDAGQLGLVLDVI